ncbi:hypothetical protein [Paenibacillus sp. NPDC058071]|uniref:hypothetical protein n=1 Tax=Paenibacillus sp. NPDC058071 TaxID=3346326 RepID=UPI0036DA8B1E
MKNRFMKAFLSLVLVVSLIPVLTAHAAQNAVATNVTDTSLRLTWTFQPGESFVQIYKNGVYLDSRAGYNVLDVTGLTPCTPYSFLVSSSYGSSTASIVTLGCPTAPVISYTTTPTSIELSWTASNAVSYDVYRDGSLLGSTSGTTFSVGAYYGHTYSIKVVAKNGSGASAQSTVNVTAQSFSATYTQTNLSGNIRVGGAFSNPHPTASTTMLMTLYRITSSGDVYVGSATAAIAPSSTTGGWFPIATSQPLGDYKVVLSSQYASTSGISIGTY